MYMYVDICILYAYMCVHENAKSLTIAQLVSIKGLVSW